MNSPAGGLPTGRPTLVCGGAGCGKTPLSLEFLVHGALRCCEPGVFMAFEETAADQVQNVASLGFDPQVVAVDPISSFLKGATRETCGACCCAWWTR